MSEVLEFIEPKIEQGHYWLGHYIAYCRLVNNSWEKRDIRKKAEYMGQNIPNIKIGFILYVQCPSQ